MTGWFLDLDDTRTSTIIAGMGGSGCIPNAISYQEIEAWARLTGNAPAIWEISALREMDRAWRAAYSAKQDGTGSTDKRYQALGEYCEGRKVDECRRQFGSTLETICATCPN